MNKYIYIILGIGIGILGSLGTYSYAKKQSLNSVNPTTMCLPTGSSQNDINAEQNCDYIYGKLEYLQRMIERNQSYITNIHADLEKHSGINTPLNPN